MNADAVIEGGGVKAIGLVGAIYEAERRGYKWNKLAGTSAGAIIASMLAAGYTAEEVRDEILTLDYTKFVEKDGISKIPLVGNLISLLSKLGIYSGDYLEDWMRTRLLVKGVKTFSDLKKKLFIIASDITSGQLLVLPDDLARYGIDPASFEVATAVRMSASIPYFFYPVKIANNKKAESHYIVDGGLLSNYPVWIFDNPKSPRWPTFGFRLISEKTCKPNKVSGPFSMGIALISTMLEAHDMMYIKEQDYVRSILVPTLGINTTDFNISEKDCNKLFEAGVLSAERFFDKWNFSQYVMRYRTDKTVI